MPMRGLNEDVTSAALSKDEKEPTGNDFYGRIGENVDYLRSEETRLNSSHWE